MIRKYRLIKPQETLPISGVYDGYYNRTKYVMLWRIEALRDFGDIKKGSIGGCVESEENLSHDGNCWIYNNARAVEHSKVYEDAKIYDTSGIYGSCNVHGTAIIKDAVMVTSSSDISGTTILIKGFFDNIKLDHGIWNHVLVENNKFFAISNTLEMMRLYMRRR